MAGERLAEPPRPVAAAAEWVRARSRPGGLSAQLLVLTVIFIMVGEVLFYVPSVAHERLAYLHERVMNADLATLSLEEVPNNVVSDSLARELLEAAGVRAIIFRGGQVHRLVLADSMPAALDASFDLRETTMLGSIRDVFTALVQRENRVLQVMGPSRQAPGALVEVLLDESPMIAHLYDYSGRILAVSLVISVLTGLLVYATLQWRLVGPMSRITRSVSAFRKDPDDPSALLVASGRTDEIGIAEGELAAMQKDLHGALRQNQHLAELGAAVSKINHDLRNILATAMLISDRIALIDEPEVRRLTPGLLKSIKRAVALCNNTLRYGRADEAPPRRTAFDLHELVDDVAASAGISGGGNFTWRNDVPEHFAAVADRDQLFRALLNLARNAVQAIEGDGNGGSVTAAARRVNGRVAIDVTDSGPGLPDKARALLFKPFRGSAREGGTGLGLAIARDIARAHDGDIVLVHSGSAGTRFRLEFPDG